MHVATVTVFAAALLGGPLDRSGERTAPQRAVVPYCQVLLIHDTEVPAQETGLLLDVTVTDGDQVRTNDLLAQMDDRQVLLDKLAAELELAAAKARAEDDIEVRYAAASHELAEAELAQAIEINRKSPGAVPLAEVRRQQLARHRAELQIDRSKLDLKIARMTAEVQTAAVQSVDQSILQRQLLAPFDGTVTEVYHQANEWVNAGDAVLRIVRLDELRVDGFLSADDYDSAELVDRDVTVEVELARGRRERFMGRVVFVNPLVQAGNKYRIRATVKNRQENGHWLLHPGTTATMILDL